ncbi:MAG: ester cyclase [Deltaproteobacteria bacterium]|nr:ester cyclase [Deltaproteobacteria bacterium]
MSQANKEIVAAYVDAFNRGDIEDICRLFSPDALVYGVLGWGGVDKVSAIWREIIDCFNLNLRVEAMVAEGNTVAVRFTERGRSVKSFRGGPVTGRSYEVVAMEWFEFKDKLIHRRWGARDSAAQFRQMGLSMSQ